MSSEIEVLILLRLLRHSRRLPYMRMKTVLVFLLLGVLLFAVSCGYNDSSSSSSGKKQVVAAFYPLAFAAEAIGGRSVEVTNLTPPGVEPHDLEAKPSDVEKIE